MSESIMSRCLRRKDAAVLERAKRTVEQWDKHDQYRQTEADKLLNDPQIGEPDDVAIARTVLRLNDVMKLAECQHMGCGGNLKPDEVVKSMRGILRDAIIADAKQIISGEINE